MECTQTWWHTSCRKTSKSQIRMLFAALNLVYCINIVRLRDTQVDAYDQDPLPAGAVGAAGAGNADFSRYLSKICFNFSLSNGFDM